MWKRLNGHLFRSGRRQKVRVYSDSVLRLGKIVRSFGSKSKMGRSSERILTFHFSQEYLEILRNDWVRVEYISLDWRHWKFSKNPERSAISKYRTWEIWRSNCLHVDVQRHRMDEEKNQKGVFQIPNKSRITRRDYRKGTGHSLDLVVKWNECEENPSARIEWSYESAWISITRSRKLMRNTNQNPTVYSQEATRWHSNFQEKKQMKWYGTQSDPPERKWDSTAAQMVKRFQESGHPVFKSISALSRGILKRVTGSPYTSLRMLRTQSSFIERFTQQISSVSTQQLPAGAKSLVWSLMKLRRAFPRQKWATNEGSETAGCKIFGANSKERRSRIWKQIARMHAELWDTGEWHPIYKSLWECDIHP